MTETFLTISRHETPWEAYMEASLLQSEGVPAFVCDDNTVRMYGLLSAALDGVRVQVPAGFKERAAEVLARRDRGEFERALDDELGEE